MSKWMREMFEGGEIRTDADYPLGDSVGTPPEWLLPEPVPKRKKHRRKEDASVEEKPENPPTVTG